MARFVPRWAATATDPVVVRDRRNPVKTDFNEIKPDPSRVGGVAEAPFVRLPNPATLFAARAARLRMLADGHTLAPYLLFLSRIVDAQVGAVAVLPRPCPVDAAQAALAAEHAMPPITAEQLHNGAFAAVLAWVLEHVALQDAPDAAHDAVRAVSAMPEAERLVLAASVMEGAFPVDRVAESLFVAAALQVFLAGLASQLDPALVQPVAAGVCPACGGAPVSSVVVGWTAASKARYCACSSCGTLWNHVRIKCTACSSTEGIAYHTIEDGPKTIGIETCTACRAYIKHMQQHEDSALDPVADDVASYALDLLAREQDFRRSGINPLFLTS